MIIYKRLSAVEREAIKSGVILGKSQSDIARELNRDKATISRELRRMGLPKENYSPMAADADAKTRQSSRKAGKRKIKGALADQIENFLLERRFSPEQTSQTLRKQFPNDSSMQASYETIYQYIYSQKAAFKRRALIKCLRRRKKCRRRRSCKNEKRGVIRNMVTIHQRPEAANKREEIGHWEGDLVVGKDHKTAILTLVERLSRYTIIVHLWRDMTAEAVLKACGKTFASFPEELKRSLTYDRGKEMALHESLTLITGMQVYFADPHAPWQRGTNENTNGLIREFFPKRTDFSLHSEESMQVVESLLNNRPRKVLGFETPAEIMHRYFGGLFPDVA